MKTKSKQDHPFLNVDERVPVVTVSSSQRNGVDHIRSKHNGRDRHHQKTRPSTRETFRYTQPHVDTQATCNIPIQRLCSQSSVSSTSSIFCRGPESTASACIRLKEKEEYSRMIKQMLRLPWQKNVVENENPLPERLRRDSDVISVCSASVLGSTNVLNLPNENHRNSKPQKISARYNVHKIPWSTPDELKTVVTQPSFTRKPPIYTPAPVPSSSSQSESANSNNNSRYGIFSNNLSNQSQLQSLSARQRRRSNHVKSLNSLRAKSMTGNSDVIVVNHTDNNKPIVIEDEPETSSRTSPPIVIDDEEGRSVSYLQSGSKSTISKNKRSLPDFLNNPYISDHYLEDINTARSQTAQERRRQIEEEDLKVKAYREKRQAQEKSLEKQLKYKMKIFEQEPEVIEEIFIEDDIEEEEVLPELTAEMEEKIALALRPGPPGQILSEAFRLQITRRDIATLGGLNWLNDEIINFYMNLLMERGERDGNAKVYAFNTFFYPKIMSGGHQAVRRWTKKVDIFAMNYIIIPVHLGMHWCLCIANMQDQVISYYDSMGGQNVACVEAVRKYVNDESVAKKQTGINLSEWQLVIEQDIPQQMNGSDCGMFTCKYAEYITRGKPITFTQEDMPYFRRRMVHEILTKQLMQ